MPPVEVLHATDGQDRGARFALLGARASIGRGPVMDFVLTDPRVSRRHAALLVEDGRLMIEDLGSTGGTAVNGHAITAPTPLHRGDRVRVGDTELTVVWAPDASPATTADDHAAVPARSPGPGPGPASPPPPAMAPAPAPAAMHIEVRVGGDRPPARVVSPGAFAAAISVVCAALGFVAIWLPALRNPSRTLTFWGMGVTGLRALALCAGLGAVAIAVAWLASEMDPGRTRTRGTLAGATAGWGGLVAGIPFFVAAAGTPGYGAASGLTAMGVAGVGMSTCGITRLAILAGPRRGPDRGGPGRESLMVAAAGAGGVCMAVSGPMAWITRAGHTFGGFDADIAAGRWLVPLGLAVTAACGLAALVGRLVDRRATLPMTAAACAIAFAGLGYAVAATVALTDGVTEAGLTLALAGGALAGLASAAALFAVAAAVPDTTPTAAGDRPLG